MESRLVEHVASGLWRLARARQVEASIFVFNQHETEYQDAKDEAESNVVISSGRTVQRHVLDNDALSMANDRAKAARSRQSEDSAKSGRIFIKDLENFDALGKLSRYESAIERSFYR